MFSALKFHKGSLSVFRLG